MSDQTVHSLSEVPGDATAHVGSRGGLYYNKVGNGKSKPTSPDYKAEGPGYSILFYKDKGGFRVRYKGPHAEEVLKRIKKEIGKGKNIKSIIQSLQLGE